MQFLDELIDLLEHSIKEDAENLITAWNIIKDGYSSSIDADRALVQEAHKWISDYQTELIETLWVTTLKIKYTNNSWYFIEVPKSQVWKVPDNFVQRQTLTQASRYTTEKLSDFESKLLSASSNLFEKEYNEFLNIRNTVLWQFWKLYELSKKIAYIDFYSNAAFLSHSRWYSTPKISNNNGVKIEWGRHPIIELSEEKFISNDLKLSQKEFIHVITWPNMWWKSTFLRQNALLILMTHMWYDIPCEKAEIWLIDKIFSRVWAGDNIFLGQSTFMVEMQEISYILRNSSASSFIIIDEIGRGTSTYDGMSLAWSILEYIHDTIGAKTLFATHYHEIIDHAGSLKGVKNFSVAVGEDNGDLVFLRKVIAGWIKKSYGIEVAKLAWIPQEVLKNAKNMLLEMKNKNDFHQLSLDTSIENIAQEPLILDDNNEAYVSIVSMLEDIDVNNTSPLESLAYIEKMQSEIKKLEKNLNNQK